jgi:hypothetical protein
MTRDTTVSDYVPLLQSLSESGHPYFLEGGLAVNFWAEFISAEVGKFRPLDTRRMVAQTDIVISRSSVRL